MGPATARSLPELIQPGWHGIWLTERCRMDGTMDRGMDENGSGQELDALFAEYRSAIPDVDGGANFMPNLWQKIEARKGESVPVFQRSPETELDALFVEYSSAFPEMDGGVNFLPALWQKIEARRNESVSLFRRLAQVYVLATAALTVVMAIMIPRIQSE